jgi:hypothetical protein
MSEIKNEALIRQYFKAGGKPFRVIEMGMYHDGGTIYVTLDDTSELFSHKKDRTWHTAYNCDESTIITDPLFLVHLEHVISMYQDKVNRDLPSINSYCNQLKYEIQKETSSD